MLALQPSNAKDMSGASFFTSVSVICGMNRRSSGVAARGRSLPSASFMPEIVIKYGLDLWSRIHGRVLQYDGRGDGRPVLQAAKPGARRLCGFRLSALL